jgi:hypothetical protein
MTVTAPPRPPRPQKPQDPVERPDPEALIEEARQRARRRRRLYGAAAAGLALIGVSLFVVFGRPEASQSAASDPPAVPVVSDGEATVVAQYAKFPFGWVFVYDDGRVLWHQYGPRSGALERRLTADGLDLVRSGALPASAFLRALSHAAHPRWVAKHPNWSQTWTPGTPLPAGLWADPEFRTYAPSRYALIIKWDDYASALEPLPAALQRLPASARTLLRGRERTYHTGDWYFTEHPSWDWSFFLVSAEEASVLEGALFRARVTPFETVPILPHGKPAFPDGG